MTKILVSEGGTIVFFEENKPISQMIGGVIISCKACSRQELVVKGSFCDRLKLCVKHARVELQRRGITKKALGYMKCKEMEPCPS